MARRGKRPWLRERDRARAAAHEAVLLGMGYERAPRRAAVSSAEGDASAAPVAAALRLTQAAEEQAALLAEQAALAALIAQLETSARLLRARQAHIATVLAAGRTV